jgi:uncharacterized protein (TIGR03083 family)
LLRPDQSDPHREAHESGQVVDAQALRQLPAERFHRPIGLPALRCRVPSSPQPLEPILEAHLYARIEENLIPLLRSLSAEEWRLPTLAPRWNVKDVAAHLLDTQLRRLSVCRDDAPLVAMSSADLVTGVNDLNAQGVAFLGRLSPAVLVSLMEVASRESAEYLQSLDPFAPARFAVSWAGEETSPTWFDVARELTERWHHQQQIRVATGRPGIMTRELYHPVLDCFMRALPFTYRGVAAPPGALVRFNISGDCGGSWYLYRDTGGWMLTASATGQQVAEATIPQEIAWRIFTKGIDPAEARAQTEARGNEAIALHVLRAIGIVG